MDLDFFGVGVFFRLNKDWCDLLLLNLVFIVMGLLTSLVVFV